MRSPRWPGLSRGAWAALVVAGALGLALFIVPSSCAGSAPPQARSPLGIPGAASPTPAESLSPAATPNATQSSGGGLDLGGGPHVATFSTGDTVGLILKLALVGVLIWLSILGMRWLSRRARFAGGGSGSLRVLDSLALGPNRSVVVVQAGKRAYVVGVTQQQMTLLGEVADDESLVLLTPPEMKPMDQPLRVPANLMKAMRGTWSGRRGGRPRREPGFGRLLAETQLARSAGADVPFTASIIDRDAEPAKGAVEADPPGLARYLERLAREAASRSDRVVRRSA